MVKDDKWTENKEKNKWLKKLWWDKKKKRINDKQWKLKITLLEELLGHFLTPLFAQLPGSAGVTDVRTLQSHLYGLGIKQLINQENKKT